MVRSLGLFVPVSFRSLRLTPQRVIMSGSDSQKIESDCLSKVCCGSSDPEGQNEQRAEEQSASKAEQE